MGELESGERIHAGRLRGRRVLRPEQIGQSDVRDRAIDPTRRHRSVGLLVSSGRDQLGTLSLHATRTRCAECTYGTRREALARVVGSLTQLHLATANSDALANGGNYHPVGKHVAPVHSQARNETLSRMLWSETERAIRLRSDYAF